MDLIDALGLTRVSLQPVGYECNVVSGDKWDDNWLIIAGTVATAQARGSFRDPCLLVEEAEEIAEWLERVATGRAVLTEAEAGGDGGPELEFLEPNLAFSARPHGEGSAIIRVHFEWSLSLDRRKPAVGQTGDSVAPAASAESAPAPSDPPAAKTGPDDFSTSESLTVGSDDIKRSAIDIEMSFEAIGRAAAQWRAELGRFPGR